MNSYCLITMITKQQILTCHCFLRINYIDLAVDENGLWAIYGLEDSNNTAVLHVNPSTLEIEYAWNISIKHNRAGDMFIVCGVLYAVHSVTERNTTIR